MLAITIPSFPIDLIGGISEPNNPFNPICNSFSTALIVDEFPSIKHPLINSLYSFNLSWFDIKSYLSHSLYPSSAFKLLLHNRKRESIKVRVFFFIIYFSINIKQEIPSTILITFKANLLKVCREINEELLLIRIKSRKLQIHCLNQSIL